MAELYDFCIVEVCLVESPEVWQVCLVIRDLVRLNLWSIILVPWLERVKVKRYLKFRGTTSEEPPYGTFYLYVAFSLETFLQHCP